MPVSRIGPETVRGVAALGARELRAQIGFQFQLEHFALPLLRALLGLAAQVFDLPLHGGNCLLSQPQLHSVFRLKPRLVADRRKRLLHLLLDGQLQLAAGIIEFSLLGEQISLRLLRLG